MAGDYCVYYSAKDALAEGFGTYVVEDATRPIDKKGFEEAKTDILNRGGFIIQSHSIL